MSLICAQRHKLSLKSNLNDVRIRVSVSGLNREALEFIEKAIRRRDIFIFKD